VMEAGPPPSTRHCFGAASVVRLHACPAKAAAFSTSSPATTASTCAP
jgi:hypothetical protein